MKTILVTGGNSQLALCIRDISVLEKELQFIFLGSKELDITDENQVKKVFSTNKIDYCINCAAYTSVDKAEEEHDLAKAVNEDGVQNIAKYCKEQNTTFIHISTDFVFDGKQRKPYKESDVTNPLGVYGKTKLNGEKIVADTLDSYYIIRTSWLYSQYKTNFFKTMLNLGKERNEISVVNDQIGSPTNASDLAEMILKIITKKNIPYGIYNYSNEGEISWFEFAKAIFEEAKIDIRVNPIATEKYPTFAKRPRYSVLDKTKIKKALDIKIPNLEFGIIKCFKNLK